MKGGIVEINWHDSEPVLTLDFHPKSSLLATGGNDRDIKLWSISPCESGKKTPAASYHSNLSYHSSAVNTLRFSPSGDLLASGADGELVIWKSNCTEEGESWKVSKRLLHHQRDVLDLQWSADGTFLVSGSVDNLCIIWDISKGSAHQVFDAHCHYVQGVAWDPLGQYISSLSSDRTCRIYSKKLQGKGKGSQKMSYVCHHVISKVEPQIPDAAKISSNKTHLFHDETLPSFFRRLSWSPDGSFLLVPGGIQHLLPTSEIVNTAYAISRKDLSRPAIQLPGVSKPIVAVRFCPIIFQLRESEPVNGLFKLPYRVVFAVATLNSLYVYDTQSGLPIAIFAGLHYAAITDIAWSPDAKYLAVSSSDSYCTLVEFENNELGSPMHVPMNADATTLKTDEASPMETDKLELRITDLVADARAFERKNTLLPEFEKHATEPNIDGTADRATLKSDATYTGVNHTGGNAANTIELAMAHEKEQALPVRIESSNKVGKKRITPVAIN